MRLTLLTFNTLGTPFLAPDITKRYKKTAELLQKSSVDIICLQELFSHYNHRLFNAWLTNYPYRVSKPNVLGLYGGLALYSKLPIEFVDFHVYTYPAGMKIPFYTKLARSGILVARLKTLPLTIITTHLTTDTVHNLTPQNTYYNLISNQVAQAANTFTSHADGKQSVILTGDFNISKGSLLYKQFLKSTGATDVFAEATSPTYTPERIRYPYPAEAADRIDYIFYKDGKTKMKILEKERVFEEPVPLNSSGKPQYLSDHMGLQTSFSVAEK